MYHFLYKEGKCICKIGYGFTDGGINTEKFQTICKEYNVNEAMTSKCITSLKSKGVVIESVVHSDYHNAIVLYNQADNRIYNIWKIDLFAAYNLDIMSDLHQLIFSTAWDNGHYSGKQEVDNCMQNIINFANNIITEYKKRNENNKQIP
jgi:hypothetical protein